MLHHFILFKILLFKILSVHNGIYYYENLPSSRRLSARRCQLLTALIKESVRSVKSFMTTERTNSKINNVTLLVISSESNLVAGSVKRDIPRILAEENHRDFFRQTNLKNF